MQSQTKRWGGVFSPGIWNQRILIALGFVALIGCLTGAALGGSKDPAIEAKEYWRDILVYALPDAHDKPYLYVTGLAWPNQTLAVRVNGRVVADTKANRQGDFAVRVWLEPGKNRIRVFGEAIGSAGSKSRLTVVDYRPMPEKPRADIEPTSPKAATKAAPPPPVLDEPASATEANPITITGSAEANSTVIFFVNGRLTRSVEADESGALSAWVPLEDDTNSVYAIAENDSGQSAASNTVTTDYTNNLPRQYSGTLSANTVWTAGDGSPYELTEDLTVPSGVTLWVQPGVQVDVAGSYELTVDGSLVVAGTETAPVVFRPTAVVCDGVSTQRSDWRGIRINAGATLVMDYAEVHCASTGVNFYRGDGEIHHSRFLNNNTAIRMQGGSSTAVISPQITMDNEIRGGYQGIYVNTNSAPLISGNEITGNWHSGVYVYGGNGAAADHPVPVVTGNDLYGNSQYDYYAIYFADPGSVVLDATDNWWGTTDTSQIAAQIYDYDDKPSLSPVVNIDGYLDGPGGSSVLAINDVSMTVAVFEPLNNEVAAGTYNLNAPATVTLQIRRSGDDMVVYEKTINHVARGIYDFTWDGRDFEDGIVASEAYRAYVIANNGTSQVTFDQSVRGGGVNLNSQVSTSYDPFRNEHYKQNISVSEDVLIRLQVTPNNGEAFWAFEDVYHPADTNWVFWNGRGPVGVLVTQSATVYMAGDRMSSTAIWVANTSPSVTGIDSVPNIEVKSDPYLIWHSYEQISHIRYRIDMDAYVTAKILPPGIYDPDHADAITIAGRALQQGFDADGNPIDHEIEWKGYNDATPNEILTAPDGPYTFVLEAESQVTGHSDVYRGVLNIRQ